MRTTPQDPRFWKPKQAAEYLQISTQTLYSYCAPYKHWKRKSKPIGPPPPFRRFGRNVIRFPIREFKEWAELKQG